MVVRKLGKIALYILALLIVVAVAAAIYADFRYHAIRSAKPVSHESIATDDTTARMVFRPRLMSDYLKERLTRPQGVPDWLVDRTLPYELALLLRPNLDAKTLESTVFISTPRLDPVVASMATQSALQARLPGFDWKAEGMVVRERGVLAVEASSPLDSGVIALAQNTWGKVEGLTPLRIEQNHLIEMVLDNRDGRLFTIIGTTEGRRGGTNELTDPVQLVELMKHIDRVRVYGDMKSETELELVVRVICSPNAEDSEIEQVRFTMVMLSGALNSYLFERYQAEFLGDTLRDGLTNEGVYSLRGFDKVLEGMGIVPGATAQLHSTQ